MSISVKTISSVLVLTLLILMPAAGKSTDVENQWPAAVYPVEQPKGRVEMITETAYTVSETAGERLFKYRLVLKYDESGKLLSEEYFNEDGSAGNSVAYSYNDGMLVLKTQYHPKVKNPDREIFIRAADGRILEAEKIFSKGNYGWKYRNSYDNTGRIILTSKYDRYWKWQLVYSRMFEYDDSGFLSATEGFGMKSELLWRDEHYYDDEGRLTESVKYNPDGNLVVRIMNEYNEQGDFTRREFFDTTGNAYAVYSYGWDYDSTGNWIVKVIGREASAGRTAYLVPDSLIIRAIEYYE